MELLFITLTMNKIQHELFERVQQNSGNLFRVIVLLKEKAPWPKDTQVFTMEIMPNMYQAELNGNQIIRLALDDSVIAIERDLEVNIF